MNRKFLYYPLFLIFLILIVDKIALIPGIFEYGRTDSSPLENIQMSMRISRNQLLKSGEKKADFVILGTSRSEIFHHLHPDSIRKAKGLSRKKINRLLRPAYDTSGIFKASEFLTHLSIIHTLNDLSKKPDLIILEVSPEMFNKNSPTNRDICMKNNIFSAGMLMSLFPLARSELKRDILFRLFFRGYAIHFRPELTLKNWVRGKTYLDDANFPIMLLLTRARVTPLKNNYTDYHQDKIPAEIFKKRFIDYSDMIAGETFLRNYEFDRDEHNILRTIIEQCIKNQLPLVIWMPPIHETLKKYIARTEFNKYFTSIKSNINDSGIPYYNGLEAGINCPYFVDSSHISARCAAQIMDKIIDIATDSYPEVNRALEGSGK